MSREHHESFPPTTGNPGPSLLDDAEKSELSLIREVQSGAEVGNPVEQRQRFSARSAGAVVIESTVVFLYSSLQVEDLF